MKAQFCLISWPSCTKYTTIVTCYSTVPFIYSGQRGDCSRRRGERSGGQWVVRLWTETSWPAGCKPCNIFCLTVVACRHLTHCWFPPACFHLGLKLSTTQLAHILLSFHSSFIFALLHHTKHCPSRLQLANNCDHEYTFRHFLICSAAWIHEAFLVISLLLFVVPLF